VTFRVRPARGEDFESIYEMAKLTGGGFTNLPPDRGALVDKIIRSQVSFETPRTEPGDDMFLFVLENVETGQIRGTCQIFGMVGTEHPFYSYRIGTLTQTSKALGKTFRAQMLNLTTDLEGSSEVGGLFLHPGERAGGLGLLLPAAAICSSSAIASASGGACSPSCAESSTKPAARPSGTPSPASSSA
jgi:arginine N-succinyltransferase